MMMRHDKIQEIFPSFFDSSSINYDTSYISEDELKSDIIINHKSSTYSIDIAVPFESKKKDN